MNYTIKIIFWILFIAWTGNSFGQDKPELAISKINPALMKNADAVIRSEVSRYIIESPRKYIHEVARTVTIFENNSPESVVSIGYNKYSKAEFISATIYDAGGSFVRKVKKSEINDLAGYDGISIMLDERRLRFRSLGGQLPYTIEYKWQIINSETIFYSDWIPAKMNGSVEKATFFLDTPPDLIVHTKTLNFPFEYKKETKDGRIVQSWTIENFKTKSPEESGPPVHEVLPMILFSPAAFQIGDYKGSMSDWKSFGTFMYELNKGREKVTPEMAALVKKMTAHCSTIECRIDTLYHWMQQNMRYVSVQLGIGGWQAFDAAYVEKNRYGDCKALSTFMKGMLQEVGIESWQVVIKWDEEEGLFLDDFMSNDFNHMMLHIPGENMWLECTSNYLPTGYIDRFEENRKVLLITPEGGKIATTPYTPATANQIHTLDTVFISDKTMIKGFERITGNMQRAIRRLYYFLEPEDRRKHFLENYPVSMRQLDRFDIWINKTGMESTLDYSATINDFGSASGERYFLPVNIIHSRDLQCPSRVERNTDFISKDDFTETNDMFITIPTGYAVEFLPSETHLIFQGQEYSQKITLEKRFIHIQHRNVYAPLRLSPDEYKDWCTYYQAVAKSNAQTIVLKKERT